MSDTAGAGTRPAQGAAIGRDVARIDARLKVTGAARYAADEALANAAHAWLVTSSIARGRIRALDANAALATPGVLDVLHHGNVGDAVQAPPPLGGGSATTTLESPRIWHSGQIVAVVVAESAEIARAAAATIAIDYEAETPSAGLDSEGVDSAAVHTLNPQHDDPAVGDAAAACAAAAVQLDAVYRTPAQHHNALELFATSCRWQDGDLTIHEPSQFVHGLAAAVAAQLGLPAHRVRVISRYVGGAFGSKGFVTARTAWIAVAARRLQRPVKLVATRAQGFTIATFRAETRQRLRLGADRDGRLQALIHEGWELSSRPSHYNVSGTATTTRLYACPNVASRVHVVHADRNTPGFMRAPPEWPYLFALESAIDELAVKLDLDPIELRRRNDTQHEAIRGLPYTSRQLMPCFDAGAAAFGWARRDPRPRSMRDGDWWVGWGCASSCYPSKIGPACARVTLHASGRATVAAAAHDIGTGAYTTMALTAADGLGLDLGRIDIEGGDSRLPPAGLAAGSSHTASICNAVALACAQLREQLARQATAAGAPLAGRDPAQAVFAEASVRIGDASASLDAVLRASGRAAVEAYAEHRPDGVPADAARKLAQGQVVIGGGSQLDDRIQYAFGAQFVELRVHALTGEIRVPRMLGVFAPGRIVSPRTARSQLMGGMIWGMASALLEESEVDPRHARYLNDNLSDYLIAAHADIGEVRVMTLEEHDAQVNALGIKGIGELGNVGTNAAVANAVFHATGHRVRSLPIRIEDLLGSAPA